MSALQSFNVAVNIPDVTVKARCVELVESLGGSVVSKDCTSTEVHVLVALSAAGDDYLHFMHRQPRPVAVNLGWLGECQRLGKKVSFMPYLLAPLAGLHVCLTGFPIDPPGPREQFPAIIEALGGLHSADMRRGVCTHLVACTASGSKYTHAKQWGNICVVSEQWLEVCWHERVRQDEAKFPPPPPGSTKESNNQGPEGTHEAAAAAAEPSMELSHGRPRADTGFAQKGHNRVLMAPVSRLAGQGFLPGGGGGGGGGVTAGQQRSVNISHLSDPGISRDAISSGVPGDKVGMHAYGGHGQYEQSGGAEKKATSSSQQGKDSFFLGWARLFLVGMSQQEIREVVKATCDCGAVREPELHHEITHILVGKDLTPAEALRVKDHVMVWSHCKVVRPKWLFECVNSRACIQEDGVWALRPQDIVPTVSTLNRTQSLGRNAAIGGLNSHQLPMSSKCSASEGFDSEPDLDRLTSSASCTMRTGVFKGLWFTLVGVKGTDMESDASHLISMNGGLLFTAANANKVPDRSKAFAICPHSLLEDCVLRLEKECRDFREVLSHQRVTVYWLRTCVELGAVMSFAAQQAPAFRPLPLKLPIPAFAPIRVHVTQYGANTKAAVKYVINLLGGVCTETLSRSNTHLLLQRAEGDKYRMAVRLGVKVVSATWLTESWYRGMPMAEEGFQPAPAADGSGALPGPPGPASLFTQGAGLLTQLGATQMLRPPKPPLSQLPGLPHPQLPLNSSTAVDSSTAEEASYQPTTWQPSGPGMPLTAGLLKREQQKPAAPASAQQQHLNSTLAQTVFDKGSKGASVQKHGSRLQAIMSSMNSHSHSLEPGTSDAAGCHQQQAVVLPAPPTRGLLPAAASFSGGASVGAACSNISLMQERGMDLLAGKMQTGEGQHAETWLAGSADDNIHSKLADLIALGAGPLQAGLPETFMESHQMDLNCSQIDIPPPRASSTSPGLREGSAEPSEQPIGLSGRVANLRNNRVTQEGGRGVLKRAAASSDHEAGGGVKRSIRGGTARPHQQQMTHEHNESAGFGGDMMMSQQIGYDEGQKMAERLTRHSTRNAGSTTKSPQTPAGSAAAAAALPVGGPPSTRSRKQDDSMRQHIINTVQQQGVQARVTRTSVSAGGGRT
ncbi:hypothetical protein CEUSTIGMA_g5619.t1 [Chlamydomonas eustigma]|uniref:BRCT domain-containing protein n=1 Tax=Chlamydomonas eustigma TaxID=1157962 RepID=A0A250X509_9CHLO|nr:hypothetical protein CEUSTIGMA_g5619.t1 [Chlamydomonas eustigma]|eukprot:GAX78177.1 hypothetical protein CEUSTIGMA_g5619.t1 [Chlamydomonas eustigma]